MGWFHHNKTLWRAAACFVLLLTLPGPWVYDSVVVPGDHPCTPPAVRVSENFCGLPVSGLQVIIAVTQYAALSLLGLVTGQVLSASAAGLFLAGGFLTVVVLPLLITTMAVRRKHPRRIGPVHVGVWGASLALGLFLTAANRAVPLWGLWLYLGLTAGMAGLEASLLFSRPAGQRPAGPTSP